MNLKLSKQFKKDILLLKAENVKLTAKVWELIIDIDQHPYTGKGKPEQLKGNLTGWWSRRINHKHCLVYRVIEEEKIEIEFLRCYGHYGDK